MVEGLLQMRAITDAASDKYMEHLYACWAISSRAFDARGRTHSIGSAARKTRQSATLTDASWQWRPGLAPLGKEFSSIHMHAVVCICPACEPSTCTRGPKGWDVTLQAERRGNSCAARNNLKVTTESPEDTGEIIRSEMRRSFQEGSARQEGRSIQRLDLHLLLVTQRRLSLISRCVQRTWKDPHMKSESSVWKSHWRTECVRKNFASYDMFYLAAVSHLPGVWHWFGRELNMECSVLLEGLHITLS